MARRFCKLVVLTLAAAGTAASSAFAQQPTPSASPFPSSLPRPILGEQPRLNKLPKRIDDFEEARRIFEQLTPEQKQRLRDNFERWAKLPPDERNSLRDQEQVRREKIAREMEETIKKTGLNLDADRRQVFALRYAQERRKIEEQLRKEAEAKRQIMMRDMIERLKNEFKNNPAAVSPSPTGSTASPSPKT
jgi:catalase